jgi:acyl-CoA synthetase (NDP forming)
VELDPRRRSRPIVEEATARGARVLFEHEAAGILEAYGIPTARSIPAAAREEAARAAAAIGFPVAVKALGVAHKSDAGLVALGVGGEAGVLDAFDRIVAGGASAVIVQEMVPGSRELVAGMVRDPVFGPCVMFGLGGILTEVLGDVTFRRAPLAPDQALEMLGDIRGHRILDGVRGMPPADRNRLAGLLTAVGRIGLDHDEITEIDLNPVILAGSRPVAADALVVLEGRTLTR